MKKLLKTFLNRFGYDLNKISSGKEYDEFADLYNECKTYTMTGVERMYALYKAVEYIVHNNIPGDFIECGVWRGGSSMLIAKTLQKFKVTDRKLFLFDTYEGMNEPTENDIDYNGIEAKELLKSARKEEAESVWCYASIEEVTQNMAKTGYPTQNIFFHKGKVEDTLPGFTVPGDIALLRLDTDWYESTKIEMNKLYPKLSHNGVLIIDDYGCWAGARKAVDEYFAQHRIMPLLNRIDYTGRMMVKTQ